MPRTSTAERQGYRCPLCDRPLARDVDGLGWVRHEGAPDVGRILSDPDKQGLMTGDDARYLAFMGLCPFERGEKDADVPSPPPPRFRHLEPRPESSYRQWFVKGRRLRAEILFHATAGPEPRTPREVADDFGVPLDAVHEAIEYCLHNQDVLRRDHEAGEDAVRANEADRPSPVAPGGVAGRR